MKKHLHKASIYKIKSTVMRNDDGVDSDVTGKNEEYITTLCDNLLNYPENSIIDVIEIVESVCLECGEIVIRNEQIILSFEDDSNED